MSRPLTLKDLQSNPAPPEVREKIASEFADGLAGMCAVNTGIDVDRIHAFLVKSYADHSKTPAEWAKEMFTEEEQAKLKKVRER